MEDHHTDSHHTNSHHTNSHHTNSHFANSHHTNSHHTNSHHGAAVSPARHRDEEYGNDFYPYQNFSDSFGDRSGESKSYPFPNMSRPAYYSIPIANPVVEDRRYHELQIVPQRKYKDIWAVILFSAHIMGVICIAAQSITLWEDAGAYVKTHLNAVYLPLAGAIIMLAIMTIFCAVWLSFVVHYSSQIINFTLLGGIIINGFFSIVSLMNAQLISFVTFGILALINYGYMRAVQS